MRIARGISKVLGASVFTLLLAVGGLALNDMNISLAHGSKPKLDVRYISAFTNDDGHVDSSSKDPHDNGIDPGYTKRVATCVAQVISSDKVRVTISNGYPSYSCTIWSRIQNVGNKSLKYQTPTVISPSALTVTSLILSGCKVLKPSEKIYQRTVVHVEQSANQNGSYQFVIKARFEETKYGCK